MNESWWMMKYIYIADVMVIVERPSDQRLLIHREYVDEKCWSSFKIQPMQESWAGDAAQVSDFVTTYLHDQLRHVQEPYLTLEEVGDTLVKHN